MPSMNKERGNGRELWKSPSRSAAANRHRTGTLGKGGCSWLIPASLEAVRLHNP